ncbi:EB module [Oesophagostomum dentatum]|uniref:EB module n=1 Tax=Oesophagostomum dentatum TaxID=61180 RepID=A0A0B1TBW9_OESDE|nr:EB module [Oesophagostomum dentatum]
MPVKQQCGTKSSPLISSTGQVAQCENATGLCPSGFSCKQNPHASGGQCMNGQVYVNGQCLNRVSIGSPCRRTEQCLGGAACNNSRCECPKGKSNVDGECVEWGDACELGMVLVNGDCVSLASPGMNCIAQEQCIDHSQCASNRCQCIQG